MSNSLQEMLNGEVTTLAFCWKLTRADGVSLGFTSHDQDLRLRGMRYAARPGMTPSAISNRSDLSSDAMEATGPLSADGLAAADLESGRWTGARIELFACDWTNPGAGRLGLVHGTMGSVVRAGYGLSETFRAELLSELAQLDLLQPLQLSPLCRAELGDGRCGVDMSRRQTEIEAAGWLGNEVQLVAALAQPENYSFGRMRWISGPLTGVDRRIAEAFSDHLILEDPLPELASEPGRLRLFEGCDKRFSTCVNRFHNGPAFDGEPHVPGVDSLQRYGGS